MKICPNCGKEIAEGSVFCEYCGAKVNKKSSKRWSWIVVIVVCFAVAAFFLMRGGEDGGAVGGSNSDLVQMNIKGSIKALNEITYFSNPSTGEELNTSNHCGLFDGGTFGSYVYSDEHIANIFYKKWFLSQISNCEIKFNKQGNITSIRSLDPEGGHVRYRYDGDQRVIEMDSRFESKNQDEGQIMYSYEVKDGLVITEHQKQLTEYAPWEMDVLYSYDNNNLIKAIYTTPKNTGYFEYSNNQLINIRLTDYFGIGYDAVYDITYNEKGDIRSISVKGGKGTYQKVQETTFEYTYDSHNNWIERRGNISNAYNGNRSFNIRTVRTYEY